MLTNISQNAVQQGLKKVQLLFKPLAGFFSRHILFTLLLGIGANALVNQIFRLKYNTASPGINLEEYYLAIFAAHLILLSNRGLIGRQYTSKTWLGINLNRSLRIMVPMLSTLVILNSLVIGITYVFYNSFYTPEDLLIINGCFVPLAMLLSWFNQKELQQKVGISAWIRWNWISVILLGLGANTLVNLIFDYKYQRTLLSTSLEEYFNAFLAAYVLLNGTRWITSKLDSTLPWSKGVVKRLYIQLLLHFFYLVIMLNLLVINITYFLYGGFYELDELLVINMSMILLTMFFTGIDTSIGFYKHWKRDAKRSVTTREKSEPILVSMGKSKHFIDQYDITCIRSKSGLTLIHTKDGRKLPYAQSMEKLMLKLNRTVFFQANRQTTIHRDTVKSYQSLPYGRLAVKICCDKQEADEVSISRARAAEFRRWLSMKESLQS